VAFGFEEATVAALPWEWLVADLQVRVSSRLLVVVFYRGKVQRNAGKMKWEHENGHARYGSK
jgi:hypothetical protein